jgi:hypothetical protein
MASRVVVASTCLKEIPVSNLPELPESEGYVHYPAREYEPEWTSSSEAYTADQMLAFAEEAVKQEREACAKVCDDQGSSHDDFKNVQAAIGCDGCADAIRARSRALQQGD